jgi:prepilin-type N-terminal cleavage/methylation domain-containing protein
MNKHDPVEGMLSVERGYSILEVVVVVGIIGVISGIAVPMFANAIANFRLSGDARSVSNAVALTKMRAAGNFTRVRLYVDLNGKTHHMEAWDKVALTWKTEGGSTHLSQGVSFSFGVVGAAPPNTQTTIDQATKCTTDLLVEIANTACIMFNSRGVPVDADFAPTGADALYLTDGTAVYGVTVAATGMVKLWRTLPRAVPSWGRS